MLLRVHLHSLLTSSCSLHHSANHRLKRGYPQVTGSSLGSVNKGSAKSQKPSPAKSASEQARASSNPNLLLPPQLRGRCVMCVLCFPFVGHVHQARASSLFTSVAEGQCASLVGSQTTSDHTHAPSPVSHNTQAKRGDRRCGKALYATKFRGHAQQQTAEGCARGRQF